MAASSAAPSAYAASAEFLQKLTPDEVALRSQLEEKINRQPVRENYSRCYHCTHLEAGFRIVATGLRPSELYNSQLQWRKNHNAGAFVTKLSPLAFGFPAKGWLERLLCNNYGRTVEGDQPKNDWIKTRGEVCLVLDLPNLVLVDAAKEDPAYFAEGRNVFYVPKEAFDLFEQKQLPPKSIIFGFRATLKEPTAQIASILGGRVAEAVERDYFEAEWLVRLALEEEAAHHRLEELWSARSERVAFELAPCWPGSVARDVRRVLLNHGSCLGVINSWCEDERRAVTLLVEALKPHSTLQELSLDADIGPLGAAVLGEALVHNSSLWALELVRNRIGAEGASRLGEALQRNSTLQELFLVDNRIGAEGASKLGEALQRNCTLQQLDLDFNGIGDIGASMLGEALQRNSALRELGLRANDIGHPGASALGEALKRNNTLQGLQLAGNSVGAEGACKLGEALADNSTLQTLGLDCNDIGDEGARKLGEALQRNSTLLVLWLSKNSIGDPGASVLGEALKRNNTLQTLLLKGNSVGAEGACKLGEALADNSTLRGLSLHRNDIGDEGTRKLGEALQRNSRLRSLWLSENSIGDPGASVLGEALQCNCALQELHLPDNAIGSEGAAALGKALRGNTSLQALDLTRNNIRLEAASALRAVLGHIKYLSV